MIKKMKVLSLLGCRLPIVFDYTFSDACMTVAVHTVKDKMRDVQISTAVFKQRKVGEWYAHHVEVYPDYRRCGVATAMYQLVQSEVDGSLLPSDDQSDDARAFWKFFKGLPQSAVKA